MKFVEFCFYPKKISKVSEALQRLCHPSRNMLKNFNLNASTWPEMEVDGHAFALPQDLVFAHKIQVSDHCLLPWVDEKKDWIAFHKPAKLHSHPLKYTETDNALSHLLHYDSNFYSLIEGEFSLNYSRRLMYRLDYETSGLMIYIKDPTEYENIRNNYLSIVKTKTYLAKVSGQAKSKDKLVHYLKPMGTKNHKMKVSDISNNNIRAELNYQLIHYDPLLNQSLLKVELKTGHRHQIRAQLSHVGLSILGDSLYGSDNESNKFNFLHLQSKKYEWTNLNGETQAAIDPIDSF